MSAALERGESPGETCVVIAINDDEYGIPVPHVRELVGYREEHFRATPQRRRCSRGVMDVRGESIPVMDLRSRLGLPEQPVTERSVVVVTRVGERDTGLLVDAVREVEQWEPAGLVAPSGGAGEDESELVCGVGKGRDGHPRRLLNIPLLLADDIGQVGVS
ncbi:MAG: chemotaxis protein CheW [Myxococcota bacterium]|nr:chemotaxis protein CheW [Myxococcota bacterium]